MKLLKKGVMSESASSFLFSILLLIISVLMVMPYLWQFDLVGRKDPFYQDYTYRIITGQLWRQGQIPLWNMYNFTGEPLAGKPYVGAFYLPNLLFVWLPPLLAHKILIIFSIWWLGLGFFIWARNKGFFFQIAKLAGVLAMILPSEWLTMSFSARDTLIWFPWMLWSSDKLCEAPRLSLRWMIVNSIIWALSFLAGNQNIWIYMIIGTIFYMLAQKRIPYRLCATMPFFILWILPQMIATYPVFLNSMRVDINMCFQRQEMPMANALKFLFSFSLPHQYAEVNNTGTYFSAILFAICLTIFFTKESTLRPYQYLLGINLVLALSLAFTNLPCYIPVLKSFRYHSRYLTSVFVFLLVPVFASMMKYFYSNPAKIKISIIIAFLLFVSMSGFWLIVEKNYHFVGNALINFEFITLILAMVLLLIIKNDKMNIPLLNILLIAVIVQTLLEYRDYVKHDMATNWATESQKIRNEILKREPIGRVYIHMSQNIPITGFEPPLNAIDHTFQVAQYPGGLDNPKIMIMSNFFLAHQPDLGSLFGVTHFIFTEEHLKKFNEFRMKWAEKNLNLAHYPYSVVQGCLNYPENNSLNSNSARGWLLVRSKKPDYAYDFIQLLSGKATYAGSTRLSDAVIICPHNLTDKPAYLLQHKSNTVTLYSIDNEGPVTSFTLENQTDETPVYGYESDEQEIVLTALQNNNLMKRTINVRDNKRSDAQLVASLVLDIMPFVLYSQDNNPGFWIYKFQRALLCNKKQTQSLPELNLPMRVNSDAFFRETAAYRLLVMNNPAWIKIAYLPEWSLAVYKNTQHVYPPSWTVSHTQYTDWMGFENIVNHKSLDWWSESAIVDSKQFVYDFMNDPQSHVVIKEWTSHRIKVKVTCSSPQILVLRNSPYDCWESTMDRNPVQWFPVNFAMQGIVIPAGVHEVQCTCTLSSLLKQIIRSKF